jgi:hypothetical protein
LQIAWPEWWSSITPQPKSLRCAAATSAKAENTFLSYFPSCSLSARISVDIGSRPVEVST